MRKQTLLNLFMLLLVGTLAALAYWGQAPEKSAPAAVHLTQLQPAQIQRIEIAFAGQAPVVLRRDGEHWFVDTPRHWPADADRVRQVLALANAVSHTRYPRTGLDAAEVGLAPPRVTVHLDDTAFAFGAQEPLNHYRYVEVGDQVHLITDTLIHQLGERPADWVSPRLVPEGAEILGIKLPTLTLTRDANRTWSSEPPQPGQSQDRFNRFIEAWRHARALAVTPASGDAGDEVIVQLGNPAHTLRYTRVTNGHDLILERSDWGLRYILDGSQESELFHLPATETAQ